MKKKENYYLNVLKILLCLIVLFYHLKLLKGGYIAVCSFFVVSGYLSFISSYKNKNFRILEYYKKRFLRIYIPMIVVLFFTIFSLSLLDIVWINIKKESLSILLGYNNIWQILSKIDYFSKNLTSPFTHYWYISLLIMFDILFPFLYLFIGKFKKKKQRKIPIYILSLIIVLSSSLFIALNYTGYSKIAYYSLACRCYSLLLGVLLGYIHSNYKKTITKSLRNNHIVMLIIYSVLLIVYSIFVNAKSVVMAPIMVIASLVTCRLLDYIFAVKEKKNIPFNNIVKYLSSLSYEIYLIQLPVIFILGEYTSLVITYILAIILLSMFINYALKNPFNNSRIIKKIAAIITIIISLGGVNYLIVGKDYAKEMKDLENHIKENEVLMKERQEAFNNEEQAKLNEYSNSVAEIDKKINNLNENLKSTPITGVGDSVMLGAINELYNTFPNSYFDAKISRTAWAAIDILNSLKNKKKLGDIIILNLGANGDCPMDCKKKMLNIISDKEIFWLNVTNDKEVHVNGMLKDLENKYSNLHVIDWNNISKGHRDYFVADKIHLTSKGAKAYSKVIYDEIYNYYLKQYEKEKETLTNSYEEDAKKGYEFYGNDLLLNVYNLIAKDFNNSKYNMQKNYSVSSLLKDLDSSKKDNVVLVFDKSFKITLDEYKTIADKLNTKKVYLVIFDKTIINELSTYDNISFIDLSKLSDDYYIYDRINLNNKGNNYLKSQIQKIVSK